MISIDELREKINEAVASRERFLFAVDFEMDKALFILNPEEGSEVLWRTSTGSNFQRLDSACHISLSPSYITYKQYLEKFNKTYSGISNGNSFLTNLTVKTPLGGDISMEEIARSANSNYLLYVPELFVCFSPEPFVRVSSDGVISSYPMKGTIDASVPGAEEVLRNDYKEKAEHHTIVDLIRSDLSRVATNVEVARFGYIESLTTHHGTILQMSSEVKGELMPEYKERYGDMLLRLLPAGSVSGAPKPTTLRLIQESEGQRRGFYCGVFGYYDGSELDSSVMIRYIEKEGDKYFYRSGGGITINSDPESEHKEVNTKIYISR